MSVGDMDYSRELTKAQNTINELVAKNTELIQRCEQLEKEKDDYRMKTDSLLHECRNLKNELNHIGGMDIRGENSRLRNCVIGLCLEIYGAERGL